LLWYIALVLHDSVTWPNDCEHSLASGDAALRSCWALLPWTTALVNWNSELPHADLILAPLRWLSSSAWWLFDEQPDALVFAWRRNHHPGQLGSICAGEKQVAVKPACNIAARRARVEIGALSGAKSIRRAMVEGGVAQTEWWPLAD